MGSCLLCSDRRHLLQDAGLCWDGRGRLRESSRVPTGEPEEFCASEQSVTHLSGQILQQGDAPSWHLYQDPYGLQVLLQSSCLGPRVRALEDHGMAPVLFVESGLLDHVLPRDIAAVIARLRLPTSVLGLWRSGDFGGPGKSFHSC